MADLHPYVEYGGGTSRWDLHSTKVSIERPEFLIYRDEKAKRATIKGEDGCTHEIYYELLGTGPKKAIFIMGLAGSHTEWECNAPFLGEDYTVCVFDNRGVGLSDSPPGRWTTSGMADDCNQLLDILTLEDTCEGERWSCGVHMIGSSMGGMIAVEAVLQNPSRYTSLTLLSTHAGGMMAALPPLSSLKSFVKTFTSKDLVNVLDNSLELKFPLDFVEGQAENGEIRRAALVKQIMRRQRKFVEGIKGFELQFSIVALLKQVMAVTTHYVSWHRLRYLSGVMQGNVLVVVGDEDSLVRPVNSAILAKELNGKLERVPGAGHALQDQLPELVNKRILAHLEACEDRRKPGVIARLQSCPPRTHPYLACTVVFTLAYILRKRLKSPVLLGLVMGALFGISKSLSG